MGSFACLGWTFPEFSGFCVLVLVSACSSVKFGDLDVFWGLGGLVLFWCFLGSEREVWGWHRAKIWVLLVICEFPCLEGVFWCFDIGVLSTFVGLMLNLVGWCFGSLFSVCVVFVICCSGCGV